MREIRELIENITGGASRAHAYIIEGRAGEARDEFMKTLVSGLLCRAAEPAGRPCARCDSCHQVAAGTNPDVVHMRRSGKTGYKTEDAALFTERLGMRPYGRYLLGIIDDAEAMSEAVQNKLLKTLEEPLPDVILLLASGRSDELLATVRSRCSTIRMQDYAGYSDDDRANTNDEFMNAAFMLLTQRGPFYEFREFTDKYIKTEEDALLLLSLTEEKLEQSMRDGKAVSMCAERIEAAERCSADIASGMDRGKALKRLYLTYSPDAGHRPAER